LSTVEIPLNEGATLMLLLIWEALLDFTFLALGCSLLKSLELWLLLIFEFSLSDDLLSLELIELA